jgi:agmatine deiminase
MPAEWELHAATWVAWPHNAKDWPGKFDPIPWVYAEIVRNLARSEAVEIIVNDAASERTVRAILDRANSLGSSVHFHRWPTDRVWTRDSGCIFVQNSQARRNRLSAVTWRFNAWAKYSNYRRDMHIGRLMAESLDVPAVASIFAKKRVVLEGGSIDVNGRGTLLTTEECLLSKVQQRNPGMKKKNYEAVFGEYLGVSNVVWLGRGITGDDTHGHVDDLARFVAPNRVVTVVEPNRKDKNHAPLKENLHRLHSAVDQDGKHLEVVELPMPSPIYFEKTRLPASYANFYIANRSVLVPVFNDANDRIALNTLAECFPDREIVPIYCGDLVWGFGTLHCLTQQQPA